MVTFLTPLASNPDKSKGSIGRAFAVCIRTENRDQESFCPFALREVSVLAELALGHLRYHLTDVPPQSNSPPDGVSGAGCANRVTTDDRGRRKAGLMRLAPELERHAPWKGRPLVSRFTG